MTTATAFHQTQERVTVSVVPTIPAGATALGVPVATSGTVPNALGLDRDHLAAAGFTGAIGSSLVVPQRTGPVLVAFGTGEPGALSAADLREAAAAFARAAATHEHLALATATLGLADVKEASQAVVEGALLARYSYEALRRAPRTTALKSIALVADGQSIAAVRAGAETGRILASAQVLARDLANTPHSHLNASLFADFAVRLAADSGLDVEIFDKEGLVKLGFGGLLGVNAGSAEPPRFIKLSYSPPLPTGRLGLVGKGIMYDSGGLSLKPSDPIHAQMKNDMSGAAAVIAALSVLRDLGSTTAVTGYLVCTDNMPSGTAMALGDVLTMRGGTTVEVIDTDAEGRLIMADALVLACDEGNDAVVDIATLTGSCLRALGSDIAGLVGNHDGLLAQVKAAAQATDEPVWELPLYRPYLRMLRSGVADIQNCAPVGKPDAILASLFLAEFVGKTPWAHLDICGTAQNNEDRSWHPAGCSGFGARLLADLALRFKPPA